MNVRPKMSLWSSRENLFAISRNFETLVLQDHLNLIWEIQTFQNWVPNLWEGLILVHPYSIQCLIQS